MGNADVPVRAGSLEELEKNAHRAFMIILFALLGAYVVFGNPIAALFVIYALTCFSVFVTFFLGSQYIPVCIGAMVALSIALFCFLMTLDVLCIGAISLYFLPSATKLAYPSIPIQHSFGIIRNKGFAIIVAVIIFFVITHYLFPVNGNEPPR